MVEEAVEGEAVVGEEEVAVGVELEEEVEEAHRSW